MLSTQSLSQVSSSSRPALHPTPNKQEVLTNTNRRTEALMSALQDNKHRTTMEGGLQARIRLQVLYLRTGNQRHHNRIKSLQATRKSTLRRKSLRCTMCPWTRPKTWLTWCTIWICCHQITKSSLLKWTTDTIRSDARTSSHPATKTIMWFLDPQVLQTKTDKRWRNPFLRPSLKRQLKINIQSLLSWWWTGSNSLGH